MESVLFYIQMCSGNHCDSCVRVKYVEALRLAHAQLRNEGVTYTKAKLEEYALNHVNKNMRCFECMKTKSEETK